MMLVTGGSGRLGSALKKVFPDALFPTRAELDLTVPDSISSYISRLKPSLIVHAAAMTSIRECEANKELCWKVNVEGTENLVKACLQHCPDSFFIYISTPCVFEGVRGMYTEKDLPAPKNMYGLSKVVAESMCRLMKNHLIARTNFAPKTQWPYEGAFTDRFGTYLFAGDVAYALKELVDSKVTGVVHIVGDRKISMHELAVLCGSHPKKITMQDYSGPQLPADMTLDTNCWRKYTIGFAK